MVSYHVFCEQTSEHGTQNPDTSNGKPARQPGAGEWIYKPSDLLICKNR